MSEVESSSPPDDGTVADSTPPSPDPAPEPAAQDAATNGAPAEEVPEEPVSEEPVADESVAQEPVADEPVAQEPAAEEPVADEPVAEEPAAQEPAAEEPPVVTPDAERPLVGPRIIGMAPPDPPPQPVKRLARPRRRRPTAADKHRRLFFQKLNEMRREGRPQEDEAPAVEAAEEVVAEETVVEEAVAEETVVEETVVEETAVEETAGEDAAVEDAAADEAPPSEDAEVAPDAPTAEADVADEAPVAAEPPAAERPARPARREAPPLDARAKARLSVAIERVGGAEVIQTALVPKQDEEGAPKRWALVCCEAATGTPPGDPVYVAWLRLASTPVREVKSALRALMPERDSGRGRGRSGGPDRGERGGRSGGPSRDRGDQPRGGGGRGGPRGDRKPREDRGERLAPGAGIDGTFTPKVRIVTNDSDERAERDRLRKEEREAKRRAAQERLDRLGF